MNTDYIIYAIIAVGVFTAYMAIVNLLRRDRMKSRLASSASGQTYVVDDHGLKPSASATISKDALKLLGVDTGAQKELSLLLLQAGITSKNGVAYFLFFKRIIQPIIFVLGALVFLKMITSTGMPGMGKAFHLLLSLLLLAIGLFGANLYVTNRKQHRQTALMHSFPEALDLLLVCIEAGLGLDAALGRVCAELKKTHPEITRELERTRVELNVLNDRVQALQNLADRAEITPFKSLVSSLIQTEKFGTSLLDTLRVLSEDQRVTRLLNAENRAARIPVLVTIPLILCILPAFIMIILGPPMVRVIEQGGIFGHVTPK